MKRNKLIATLSVCIILLIASISIYCSYPTIVDDSKEGTHISQMLDYTTTQVSYNNYCLKKELNPNQDIYDLFFHQEGNTESLKYNMDNWIENLNLKYQLKTNQDIAYYAKDNINNKTTTNTQDNISDIYKNKELQDKYQLYFQVTFDKYGNRTVNYSSISKIQLEEYLDTNKAYHYSEANSYQGNMTGYVTLEPLKNLTVTYAVVKDLNPDGALAFHLNQIQANVYITYLLPYVIVATLITIIAFLIIPFKYIKENKVFHTIAQIKFGILAPLWGAVCYTSFYYGYYVSLATINNQLVILFDQLSIKYIANYLIPVLNVLCWFVFFGSFVVLTYMVKYLFHKGFKRYFLENTCISWLYFHCKKLINWVLCFDFQSSTNKLALKIVLFNFVIMSIISIFFVFGIALALIYSVIIFTILKKKFKKIHGDYDVLLNATKQLSSGNFDYKINQDAGVFNPLKDEFSHIKDGFEKAVKEEVKSQRMKTELISNVSHDLKTPLTSIITYVDLLKNNELSPQQSQEYIHILDRNSLRLKNLIDDLFEVSKVNSGDIHLELVDVDIVSLIKQAGLECQEQLAAKYLDIRTQISDDKIICHLDSSKTYRIFENLFMNISKYALEHTRIYLNVEQINHEVVITIKNISKDEMRFNENEIVERFVQGDKSRNTSGSGLGLAIVKSFTEIQGGSFDVELDGDLFKSIVRFPTK